jgi:hypothetical protein
MIQLIPSFVTRKPLSAPTAAPMRTTRNSARPVAMSLNQRAKSIPQRAAFEVIERSSCPPTSSSVLGRARMPNTDMASRMFSQLSTVRKKGDDRASQMIRIASIPITAAIGGITRRRATTASRARRIGAAAAGWVSVIRSGVGARTPPPCVLRPGYSG